MVIRQRRVLKKNVCQPRKRKCFTTARINIGLGKNSYLYTYMLSYMIGVETELT